jgi:hypothetical protein
MVKKTPVLHNVYLKYFYPKNTISCGGFGLLIEHLVVFGKAVPRWKSTDGSGSF